MPWDLDYLEDDAQFAEIPTGLKERLQSMDSINVQQAFYPFECDFAKPAAEPTPTIFLNVDGVLHPRDALHDECLGDEQLAQLKRIVDASGAQIVLSSSWRLDNISLQRVNSAFQVWAIDCLIDITPDLQLENPDINMSDLCIGEIGAWLDEKGELADPDHWIVIDDRNLDTETEDGTSHTVMTDGSLGLTAEIADKAILMLTAR
eukprot:TRINITY_DN94381_c0_g1_i1.p1 TRINITY_DN94381_c0_g1~~TRINITY_DN94381_c0_g1_i1.p1  ORF type:complete len:223 (-),score=60.21 TRINITY_DN94381_c0_g1_i1:138-752(-)